jgi:hypothetical protein
MPQRVFSFVVVLVLFFTGEIFSQKNPPGNKTVANYNSLTDFANVSLISWNKERGMVTEKIKPALVTNKFRLSLFALPQPVSRSFYFNCLGFFCKKELQVEKITSVPFRFRLGSLDYVNYLEQKPNALRPE